MDFYGGKHDADIDLHLSQYHTMSTTQEVHNCILFIYNVQIKLLI